MANLYPADVPRITIRVATNPTNAYCDELLLFVEGLNVILVSRSTLFNSRFSVSLYEYSPGGTNELGYFKDAKFSAYDSSKNTQNAPIVGVISVRLSGLDAMRLITDYLLVNSTGNKSAEARVLSTEQVHQVSGLILEGLQGLANFVSEWGLRWLGKISETYEAVRDAAQKVVDAVNAIVGWIIYEFKKSINILFSPIVNKIQSLLSKMCEVFLNLVLDSEDGKLIEENIKPARDILVMLYSMGLTASLALSVIIYAFGPFAVLVSLVIPIVMVILYELLIDDKPAINVELPAFTFDYTLENLFDFIEPILGTLGNEHGSRLTGTGEGWQGIVGALLSTVSLSGSVFVTIWGFAIGKTEIIGKTLGLAVFSAISLMISYLIQGLIPNTSVGIQILRIFAVVALAFSLSSMIGAGIEILLSLPANVPGITLAGFCLGGLAAIGSIFRLMDP